MLMEGQKLACTNLTNGLLRQVTLSIYLSPF